MDGRELTSGLSASVLLFLEVELPDSMLVPCPGSMQGILSHAFFCYTAALFCNETNKYEPSFSTQSLFWIFYLFCIYGYLLESLKFSCLCGQHWNYYDRCIPGFFIRVEVSELGFSCLHDKHYTD